MSSEVRASGRWCSCSQAATVDCPEARSRWICFVVALAAARGPCRRGSQQGPGRARRAVLAAPDGQPGSPWVRRAVRPRLRAQRDGVGAAAEVGDLTEPRVECGEDPLLPDGGRRRAVVGLALQRGSSDGWSRGQTSRPQRGTQLSGTTGFAQSIVLSLRACRNCCVDPSRRRSNCPMEALRPSPARPGRSPERVVDRDVLFPAMSATWIPIVSCLQERRSRQRHDDPSRRSSGSPVQRVASPATAERGRERVGGGHWVVGLDPGGVTDEPLVRESSVDHVAQIPNRLGRGVLAVKPSQDVVDLTEIDPRHQWRLPAE